MKGQSDTGQLRTPRVSDKAEVASYVRRDIRIETPHGSLAEFKMPRLTTATSAESFHDRARAPQYMIVKAAWWSVTAAAQGVS